MPRKLCHASGLFARSKDGETIPKNAQGRFLTNVGILTCSRAIRLVTHVHNNTNLYMQIVQLAMTLVHADFLLLGMPRKLCHASGLFARSKDGETIPKNAQWRY